jgi:hypothetical protein
MIQFRPENGGSGSVGREDNCIHGSHDDAQPTKPRSDGIT